MIATTSILLLKPTQLQFGIDRRQQKFTNKMFSRCANRKFIHVNAFWDQLVTFFNKVNLKLIFLPTLFIIQN